MFSSMLQIWEETWMLEGRCLHDDGLLSKLQTSASLKLAILNPKARIWTMVAGGGASVIYADTVTLNNGGLLLLFTMIYQLFLLLSTTKALYT
jgi:hypothetical protein